MKYLLSITLLFVTLSAHAEIYKGTDAEGQVIYSDQVQPGAEIIPTPSPNTIQMPKSTSDKPATKVIDDISGYDSFTITRPIDKKILRSSTGKISISFSIEPTLDIEQKHRIAIYIDGQMAITSTELNAELTNVSRGKHTLSAKVIGKDGKQIISSNTVTIHMKRLSSQHEKPTGTPPEPIDPSTGRPQTAGPINPLTGKPYKPGTINPLTGEPYPVGAINPLTGKPYPVGPINPVTGQPYKPGSQD